MDTFSLDVCSMFQGVFEVLYHMFCMSFIKDVILRFCFGILKLFLVNFLIPNV
jgi:hypothetical protein